jgi:hypothetical protein
MEFRSEKDMAGIKPTKFMISSFNTLNAHITENVNIAELRVHLRFLLQLTLLAS